MIRKLKKAVIGAAATLSVFAMTTAAHAFTPPATGDLAYDLYDIIVNQGIEGPLGFMAGVLAIAFGAFTAIRGAILSGLMSVLAGAVLISAQSIMTSIGFVV